MGLPGCMFRCLIILLLVFFILFKCIFLPFSFNCNINTCTLLDINTVIKLKSQKFDNLFPVVN